jgi:acyl-coenzyme A synthetase/AMP-(fatty) acid ligase
MQSAFGLSADERILQQTPAIFDASVWELLTTLMAGATLVIGSPGPAFDPSQCVELIAQRRLTFIQFVPALLALILDEPGISRCDSVRQVIVGGDALTPGLRDRFFERMPQARLINAYGPTEACIDAVVCDVANDGSLTVPIGRPIANCHVYVLGPNLELVPIGADGELYIGGAGVALGYINRPALTAERFIPDPFAAAPDARIYRTGDRVRYRPDGNLEFLGRFDDQVKVHGVRIELQEIESVLSSHPDVQQVAVAAHHDAGGDAHLAAYYVTRNPAIADGTLRRFLRQALPESMVPGTLMRLEALPLMANGKLDREALPAVTFDRTHLGEPFEAPRSSLESAIAGIWTEVLNVAPIGIHDDFFALGGHSLLATQVVSRVNHELNRTMQVRQLFETTTIATLAEALERVPASPATPISTTIRRVPRLATATTSERGPA